MAQRWLSIAVAAGLVVAPAFGGITFRLSQTSEGGEIAGHNTLMQVSASGPKSKAEFVVGQEPMMPAGSYVLSQSAGDRGILVNPKTKTWVRLETSGMTESMAGMMKSMEGMMKISYKDLEIEDLGEEDGGTVAGFPTRRHRVRVTYVMEMKMPMMSRDTRNVVEDTFWTTSAVEGAIPSWLAGPPRTGRPELDSGIEAKFPKLTGFLLKRVHATKTSGMGRDSTITETTEISDVKSGDVPEETFRVPAGYRETQMMSSPAEMPDLPK